MREPSNCSSWPKQNELLIERPEPLSCRNDADDVYLFTQKSRQWGKMRMRVTGVMVTGHDSRRHAMAKIAIRCFLRQTYRNKELVIINHGANVFSQCSSEVREIRIDRAPAQTLGELRNMGLAHGNGDLFIAWDDDDWHHPRRIEIQVAAYVPGHAVMLRRQIRYNLLRSSGYAFDCPWGITGTVLFGGTDQLRYPYVNQGEDSGLVALYRKHIIVDNDPLLYVRFYHGMNVCGEKHIMGHLADVQDRREFAPHEDGAMHEILREYAPMTARCSE